MTIIRPAIAAATGAAAIALLASGALATDLPVIPGVKTKVSVKAVPIVCPFSSPDTSANFFGLALPAVTGTPCLGKGKAKAKIVAAAGSVTATIKVQDKANPAGVVNQTVTIHGRLHDDGCNATYVIPELTFSGPAQGLPSVPLVNGKALITVTSDQIFSANPGIFPVPRPLCPSDIFTIRHLLEINGCCYEATFTIHHAG